MAVADHNEIQRLTALHAPRVLHTRANPAIDAIPRAAADLCGAPMALVSLVDEQRQGVKARVGIGDVSETSRDIAFCDHAIRSDQVMVVCDAASDPRFRGNPLVTGELSLRFYAGAPLITAGGERIGTLCVLDTAPGQLSRAQIETLERLATTVVELLAQESSALKSANAGLPATGHPDDKRVVLVQHAKAVLASEGASKFSMRKVALAAGVSLSNVQHYFPSKNALLAAMVESLSRSFYRNYKRAIEPIPNALDRLLACAEYILDQGPDQQMVLLLREFWCLANHDDGLAASLAEFYRQCQAFAADIMSEANPDLDPASLEHRACAAISLLSGAFIYTHPWTGVSDYPAFRDYVLSEIVRLPFDP